MASKTGTGNSLSAGESFNEIAIQNQIKYLSASIEKSAQLHSEFWSQLSEDSPDLTRLAEIGGKINFLNSKIEEAWNRLQFYNLQLPQLTRFYGRYTSEILNDKKGSYKILESLNKHQLGNNVNQLLLKMKEVSNESTPTISISGEEENLGIITNLNLAAANLFGYNRNELLS